MTREQLAALFRAERARFAAAYPRAAGCGLELLAAPCPVPPCAARDLAAYLPARHVVQVAARALELPRASLVGLLRHELGHVCDPRPEAPGAEARADRIAARVGGARIRYDDTEIQTIDPRARYRTRPGWLHR